MDNSHLLDVHALSKLLCISPKTIRWKSSLKPDDLPPRFLLPGSRLLRWHSRVVQEWLDAHIDPGSSSTPESTSENRKVGRPRGSKNVRVNRQIGGGR